MFQIKILTFYQMRPSNDINNFTTLQLTDNQMSFIRYQHINTDIKNNIIKNKCINLY